MGKLETAARSFSNRGLLLKSDSSLIPPDRYQELTNFISAIEGSIRSRNGYQRVALFGAPNIIHTMDYLLLLSGIRARYIGSTNNGMIWRSYSIIPPQGPNMTYIPVAIQTSNPASPYTRQVFTSADASVTTGTLYKFFACQSAMLKDNGSLAVLQKWGIIAPVIPITGLQTSRNTSGPAPFFGSETPYTYVYTYYNASTGSESNPCEYMPVGSGITPNGFQIKMALIPSPDSQVNFARYYRAGGAFTDGLYRFVGQVGVSATNFFDSLQDSEIASNQLLQTDNDPPVTSALSTTFYAFVAATSLQSGGNTPAGRGLATITIGTVISAPSNGLAALTYGSEVIIGLTGQILPGGFFAPEVCRVVSNNGVNQIQIYVQNPHPVPPPGADLYIQCSSSTANPASLSLAAFGSVFLAGDPNNPHVLYQSKTSLPESFPLVEQGTLISKSINVSNPSDPIMGIVEYGGNIICLCLKSIYTVAVFNGAMGTPIKSPAQRGVIGRRAWVRISNEIWYVSYDGIYSYAGGEESWKSEAIDPLFQPGNEALGQLKTLFPVDLQVGKGGTGADAIILEYEDNEVFVYCNDITGSPLKLRYHKILDRWSTEVSSDPLEPSAFQSVTAVKVETDTGYRLFAKSFTSQVATINLDNTGTTDGWVSTPGEGKSINLAATPATLSISDRKDILYSDCLVDYSSVQGIATQTIYNFGAPAQADPADTFTIPGSAGVRTRFARGFQAGQGKYAYAITQRFTGSAVNQLNLYSNSVTYTELAEYKVGLAFDYDDLGYPNLKTLQRLNIEIDTGGIQALIQLQGDGVNMGNPIPITTAYATRKQEIWLDSPTYICRMVRMVITPGPGGKTQYYQHKFDFLSQPAIINYLANDIETEWNDLEYVNEKTLRALNIECDTGGVQAVILVQGDGKTLDSPFAITTTYQDRNRIVSIPSNLTARMIRLILTPGAGGYVHYYKHSFDFVKEPASLTYFDSLEFTFGYDGYSFIKQCWIQYQCATAITMTFISDGGEPFHVQMLPAQPYPERDVQRFYLPDHGIITPIPIFGTGVTNPGVLTAPGSFDTHWIVQNTPNNPNWNPKPPIIGANSAWYASSQSQWVSLTGPNVTVQPGTYRYRTVFDMTGLDISTAVLTGQIGGATIVSQIELNGVPILGPLGNQNVPTLFTISSGFLASVNVLDVLVSLPGVTLGLSGLNVKISGTANAFVLNKSKRHQFTLSSDSPFKFWAESSRMEYILCGSDQRSAYKQSPLSEIMQPLSS